jgi:hypothetical protein
MKRNCITEEIIMKKVLPTLITTLIAVSLFRIVFAHGVSTPTSGIGAPASAGGAPAGAGSYTSTPAGNAPASASIYTPTSAGSPASSGGAPASAGGAPDIGSVNPPSPGAN